ncbi:DUF4350 domain-containing protein [Microbacterium sp. P01]|uniref:DUF4350 domain-containing protein n=1 Tax=Microbacterium sp. P01 TaxID=3366261 RepID=UPI00366CB213
MTSPDTGTAASTRRRSALAWGAIVAVLVLVGIAGTLLASAGQWSQRGVLDPESAGPSGTRALVQILRDRGVEVTIARDRDAARSALAQGEATLVLADTPLLSDDTLRRTADAATSVVLIDPRARSLRVLLPGSSPGGVAAAEALAPSCDVGAADRSGDIDGAALFRPGAGVVGCYPEGEGYGLLTDGTTSAVDGAALFTNAALSSRGNAALAINLMGQHPKLVWYIPSAGDTDRTSGSLGAQTPDWVAPSIVLLLCAGVAAALWRGRRFGPLVAERLPVTVRAAETMEGRARLYARSRDAVHAADQLRIGTLGRLAQLLALGPSADAAVISDAAASRLSADRGVVRAVLIDDLPRTDADLVALSDRLRDLENAVRTAVRPERNRP